MNLRAAIFVLFTFFCQLVFIQQSYSQLQVTPNLTPEELVEILVGSGVEVSNITYTGASHASGSFTNGNTTNIDLNSGIILTTGKAMNAIGPNNIPDAGWLPNNLAGDADLQAYVNYSTNDASILEFDFIPYSDTIFFEYVFASEEYHEYVDDPFNDIFAFFLTGPDPLGGNYNKLNMALIPGTNQPVSIHTVNNGSVPDSIPMQASSGPCTNCLFFVDNFGGQTIQYDGFTTVLSAGAKVIPCQTYHFKIAIADVADGIFDSGVFLKENSFQTDAVESDLTFSVEAAGTKMYEGCNNAIIDFKLPGKAKKDRIVKFIEKSGTATEEVDFIKLPDSLIIKAGDSITQLIIEPLADNLIEGTEHFTIIFEATPCEQDTVTITLFDYIPQNILINNDTAICIGNSMQLFSSVSNGTPPYTYQWEPENGLNDSNIPNPVATPDTTTTYFLTVHDTTKCFVVDSVKILVNDTPNVNKPSILLVFDEDGVCDFLTDFDLTQKTNEIIGNQANIEVSYHFNHEDAVANENPLPNPYRNISKQQTIFARATHISTGCYNITDFDITTSIIPTEATLEFCDTDKDDITLIDFSVIDTTILPNSEYNSSYYLSQDDAENRVNPLINFTNTTNPQIIFARVENQISVCIDLVAVTLVVHPAPDAPLSKGDTAICEKEAVPSLKVLVNSGETVDWYDAPADGNLLKETSLDITPTQTGTYYAETRNLTTNCGSSSRTAVTLTIYSLPEAPVSNGDKTICSGEDSALSVTTPSGITVDWYADASGGLPLDTSSLLFTPKTAGIFFAEARNIATGCLSSERTAVIFIVNPLPVAPVSNGNITICEGQDSTLSVTVPNSITVDWFDALIGGNLLKNEDISFIPPDQGVYFAEARNKTTGCISNSRTAVSLTVHSEDIITVSASKTQIYRGESVNVSVNGYSSNSSILWNTGSTEPIIAVIPDVTIQYKVQITTEFGCVSFDSITIVVDDWSVDLGGDLYLCDNQPVELSVENIPVAKYLWSTEETTASITVAENDAYTLTVTIGNVSQSDAVEVEFTDMDFEVPPIKGCITFVDVFATGGRPPYQYSIDGQNYQPEPRFLNIESKEYTFYVKDNGGCIKDTIAMIESPSIPNYFSPNNDDINDVWEIKGLENCTNAIVTIFDRYSRTVHTMTVTDFWDGIYLNKPMPTDTYWYVIEFNDGVNKMLKGNITIKRR